MRYFKFILPLIAFCAFTNINAQLSTNEKPVSFGRESEMRVTRRSEKPSVVMPQPNKSQLKKVEAKINDPQEPGIFGFGLSVNWNLNNSGIWYEFPNGDLLWQLEISCPEDRYILLFYDKFWLPVGGELYLYSKDGRQALGAFTSCNNKGDREHPHRFVTGMIKGSTAVLEYYQPLEVTTDAIISICNVVYGGGNSGFTKADSSLVNVNCEEGNYWRGEQKAIARAIFRTIEDTDTTLAYATFCSGSLISTSDPHGEAYFLTAHHCLPSGKDSYTGNYTDSIMDDALFFWEYEMPGCDNDTIEPPSHSTAGAAIVAACDYNTSDFALLKLKEDPNNLPNYIPYYLGWDRTSEPDTACVCIHHPKGDVKKISTVDDNIEMKSCTYNGEEISAGTYWEVWWMQTNHGNGGTQKSSSGSPLLNVSHKVIGQLHAGPLVDFYSGPDRYGKFYCSWDNSYERHSLKNWLDSLNTGTERIEGTLYISKPCTLTKNEYIYGNIHITGTGQLNVQGNIELGGNGNLTIEAGGKLIINGRKLTNANINLKPGATLRIINNGTIESRKGFKAPIGAIVDIKYGRIL